MRKIVIVAIALVALGLEVDKLPAADGAGTAAAPAVIGPRVALVCTSCHGAQTYAQLRASRDEWRRYVYEMMLHGAQIRAEEFEPIINYLANAYGLSSAAAGTREPPQAGGQQGEALVNRACTSSCHALDLVTAVRRTPDDWNDVLTRMQNHGAKMTDAERQAIAGYLVEHFGRR
jgi:Quinohemoprotein amine dehydrogenase A, alpha subunit, haem binding